MAHQVVLPKSETCDHASVIEYWHDYGEKCDLDDCAVVECLECNEFATECEQGSN